MARTQAADYDQRREAIVDTAAELFAERSFLNTSVAMLAKECNMSKSLIYHYFPSKEDILYEVMLSHIDRMTLEIEATTPGEGDPFSKLIRLRHSFLRDFVGSEKKTSAFRQKVLLNEVGNLPKRYRNKIVSKQKRIVKATEKHIVALDPTLADKPDLVRVKTMLLFGMINSLPTWYHPEGPIGIEELERLILDMIFGDSGR